MSLRVLILAAFLAPSRVRIRCDDDPGLVYVPVGPTSDFRVKVPDEAAAQNASTSASSTLSPFGMTFAYTWLIINFLNDRTRTGPRSAARFKPEMYPKSSPQKCTPKVHPISK